jgi:dihydrofolate reductase
MPMHIEAYAIISEDGMIADAAGRMPAALTDEADQRFFHAGLDRAAVVVQGRNSYEGGPRAPMRKRLIVTRSVAALAPDPLHSCALLWNPAGSPLSRALAQLGVSGGTIAVIGGADVYEVFWQEGYDAFHLTRVAGARLPGGRPVFRALAAPSSNESPEDVLASHGMQAGSPVRLAPGVTLVTWHPAARHQAARQ